MRKTGFTLAEVLITLAIIGVVATLTLPALMTNTAEQQAITAYKKIMNSLNEAGQMNAAIEGFDYSVGGNGNAIGAVGDKIENGKQTLTALFNERLQVSAEASKPYGSTGKCTSAPVLVLRDGTAICMGNVASIGTGDTFYKIYVDTNAQKGPNEVSTCTGSDCATKANRHIHDQFPVTLHRGIAVPGHWTAIQTEDNTTEGAAARYAMGIGNRKS